MLDMFGKGLVPFFQGEGGGYVKKQGLLCHNPCVSLDPDQVVFLVLTTKISGAGQSP